MGTLRHEVSRVRSTSKLLSGDNSINDRTIAAELKSSARVFIKQYTNSRRLWETDSIFTTIPCLEMEAVPIGECCTYSSHKMVSRSKHKLPSIAEGNFMYIIQGIYALDLNQSLLPMTVNRYINALKLGLKNNNIYYWLHNDYVYCSSEFVQTLKMIAYIDGDLPREIEFPECECEHSASGTDKCKNPLDEPFKCPGFLIDAAVKETRNTLLSTYFKTPIDHNSDNKDDQVNRV